MMLPTIDTNRCYALCKLPKASTAAYISADRIETYASLAEVPADAQGFIIAPFETSQDTPVYILAEPHVEEFAFDQLAPADAPAGYHATGNRNGYSQAFQTVRQALTSGKCDKVVLARAVSMTANDVDILQLFLKACAKYPYCFVCVFSIPGKGTWLTATPELLYRQQGNSAYTMALAGTMLWSEHTAGTPWSEKNKREQGFVTDFITSNLDRCNISYCVEPLSTAKAGHLAHLCTKISITPADNCAMQLLRVLHPTPAIAGIPRQAALEVIRQSEGPGFRGYYAGFTGFLNTPFHGTHCFVSLRLMHLTPNRQIRLYAGGGILPESNEEAEWQETELKLQTIGSLL